MIYNESFQTQSLSPYPKKIDNKIFIYENMHIVPLRISFCNLFNGTIWYFEEFQPLLNLRFYPTISLEYLYSIIFPSIFFEIVLKISFMKAKRIGLLRIYSQRKIWIQTALSAGRTDNKVITQELGRLNAKFSSREFLHEIM